MDVAQLTNRAPVLTQFDYDNDRTTKFIAPKCRLSNGVIALCAAMTGIVLTVSGLCTIAFFTEDDLMLAPGIAMTLIGAAMTLIGVGYYASKMIVCNESIAHVIARHLPQTTQTTANRSVVAIPPPSYDSIESISTANATVGSASSSVTQQ